METNMLFTALREFTTGLLNQLLVNLSGQDGQVWLEELKRFLRKEPCWVGGAQAPAAKPDKLLQFVTSLTAPATKKFVATNYFKEGKTVNGVPIAWLSNNFKMCFLPKEEVDIPETVIRVHKLTTRSRDLGIRAEIGEANEEIMLAQFWAVIESLEDGWVGKWLFGYVVGVDGNTWAVSAYRGSGGWNLNALSVEDPGPWGAGSHVLSR